MADLAAREQRSYQTKAISSQPEVVERHSVEVVRPASEPNPPPHSRTSTLGRRVVFSFLPTVRFPNGAQNCMDAASFGENTYALRRLRAFLDQVCTRYFDRPTNRKGSHPPIGSPGPHVQMYDLPFPSLPYTGNFCNLGRCDCAIF
jgi:hypothetical protein